MSVLKISNLHAGTAGKKILCGLDLEIKSGETHAIMGPNGTGKSTLANLLAGKEGIEITAGSIHYEDKDLTTMLPEERAREGIFLGFQYPVEIPGITNTYLLKAALNAIRKHRGEKELDSMEFLDLLRERMQIVDIPQDLMNRSVNEGFSGGEKKRNEVFQMAVLEPRLAILDETDSGLDIDSLKTIANSINRLRDEKRSFLLITHYQRLLNHIKPDRVHILYGGKIVRSGTIELAMELESQGYDMLKKTDNAA